MSIYLYTIFETIAEQNSFVRAAEILNLTPSAVSHAIAKLESDIGFSLFIRSRKGVKLTNEGELLLPYIRNVQRSNENLEQVVSQMHNVERGLIRIGTINSITVNWLPQIINTFRREHQNIEITVYQGGYYDILRWIRSNSVDIAFIADTVLPADMSAIPLHKDRIMCVVPLGFEPKNSAYITVDDIKDMTFVMQTDDYDQEAMRILKENNLSAYSQFYLENDSSIVSMVEAGFGAAILSDLICKSCKGKVGVYPFVPERYRTISLICANPENPSLAVQKMKDHIIHFIHESNLDNL